MSSGVEPTLYDRSITMEVKINKKKHVQLVKTELKHEKKFLAFTKQNVKYHSPWIPAPTSSEKFNKFIDWYKQSAHESCLVLHIESKDIVGVINFNCIIHGFFKSSFLGYYGNEKYRGTGLMFEGMSLAIKEAFTKLKLHRLEANIQPLNKRSINLVKNLGFTKEGYSKKYLKVNGIWRDHERWALIKE